MITLTITIHENKPLLVESESQKATQGEENLAGGICNLIYELLDRIEQQARSEAKLSDRDGMEFPGRN